MAFLFTLPETVWEAFLGIYLTFWEFRPAGASALDRNEIPVETMAVATPA